MAPAMATALEASCAASLASAAREEEEEEERSKREVAEERREGRRCSEGEEADGMTATVTKSVPVGGRGVRGRNQQRHEREKTWMHFY